MLAALAPDLDNTGISVRTGEEETGVDASNSLAVAAIWCNICSINTIIHIGNWGDVISHPP